MSVGQLCDVGYKVHFNSDKATVNDKENIVLTAPMDQKNGLWRAPLINMKDNKNDSECNQSNHHTNTTGTYLSKCDSRKTHTAVTYKITQT
jgi:hypothetical protein